MSFAAHAAASLPNVKLFKYHSIPAYYLLSSLFARQSKTMPHSSPNSTSFNLIHASFDDCFTEEYIHFIDQCRAQDPGREHGVLINSSRVFDDEFIDILSRETNKKLYIIGPVNPVLISGNKDSDDDQRHDECLEWLDKQRDESVVYVSFGSTTTLSDEQVEELAMGLEKSGQRFIWVLRDADHGGDVFADEKKAEKMRCLPEGYEERIEGMGMVVRGWAPQLEILAHKANGGFMSHCGWNSCMESLSFGVPLLAWPMHSDQPRNAMAVSEYLKVGVMVRDWEHRKEVVTSMEIVEVVKRLMVSDEGMEMRKRAVALGEQIRVGVSEGMITCEDLDRNSCAFAVSSSGTRCVLEMRMRRRGYIELSCRTSNIEAEKLKDYVETDECIKACGLDRNTIGISSDSLLDSQFTRKLCSSECYNSCPNIVDLYFNLAAGEGAFLPKLCVAEETSARRGMAEIRSLGVATARPVIGVACAPSPLAEPAEPTEPPM
ncbi:hypothetical protein J5N97_023069 [Dioscorea zingiberensis]|uniref:Glycosyltransferase n=1 Tax=Dioscorea zingiberensis TaxID=325984 RepID=A0A9D5CBM2_9LILI|nr:hypothetical protein J5N97_023069 [Dioscorea zingiberensis]